MYSIHLYICLLYIDDALECGVQVAVCSTSNELAVKTIVDQLLGI